MPIIYSAAIQLGFEPILTWNDQILELLIYLLACLAWTRCVRSRPRGSNVFWLMNTSWSYRRKVLHPAPKCLVTYDFLSRLHAREYWCRLAGVRDSSYVRDCIPSYVIHPVNPFPICSRNTTANIICQIGRTITHMLSAYKFPILTSIFRSILREDIHIYSSFEPILSVKRVLQAIHIRSMTY